VFVLSLIVLELDNVLAFFSDTTARTASCLKQMLWCSLSFSSVKNEAHKHCVHTCLAFIVIVGPAPRPANVF